MPPKKEVERIKVGDVDVTDFDFIKLLGITLDTLEELKGARKERNRAQHQRDAVRNAWKETKHRLDETREKTILTIYELEEIWKEPEERIKASRDEIAFNAYEARLKRNKDWYMEMDRKRAELKFWEEDTLVRLEEKKLEQKKRLQELCEQTEKQQGEQEEQRRAELEEIKRVEGERSKECMEKERKRFAVNYETIELYSRLSKAQSYEFLQVVLQDLDQLHAKEFTAVKNFFREAAENDISLIEVLRQELAALRHQTNAAKKSGEKLRTKNERLEQRADKLEREVKLVKLKEENTRKELAREKRMADAARTMKREAADNWKQAKESSELLDKAIAVAQKIEHGLEESTRNAGLVAQRAEERWRQRLEAGERALERKKESVLRVWTGEYGEEEAQRRLQRLVGPRAVEEAVEGARKRALLGATAKQAHFRLGALFQPGLYPEGSQAPAECRRSFSYTPAYLHYSTTPHNLLEPSLGIEPLVP
ncbi:hypothetical protein AAG570_008790 [Ranatra chinensis]|uniref:Uncharacterized protein n=1 Tax=Ranatra chinensis TaxID=642074 RepID=A0ABD0ZD36_9HEMI